jgi:hypothetical protein
MAVIKLFLLTDVLFPFGDDAGQTPTAAITE